MSEFIQGIITCWDAYGSSYIAGAGRTLLISFVGTVIGCLIGFIVGIVQTIPTSKNDPIAKKVILKIANAILKIYVEVFRGTPMIVQAVFIYYGARMAFGIGMGMWAAAFFIVSINTGAYMAETVRGGLQTIPKGQFLAADSLGMNTFQTYYYVILPQALVAVIPAFVNSLLSTFMDTSLVTVVSMYDLTGALSLAMGDANWRDFFREGYIFIAAIYFVASFVMSRYSQWLEKRLTGNKKNSTISI